MNVRLSSRFLGFMSGGQLWQTPDDVEAHGYGEGGRSLVRKISEARSRKDGSVTLNLNEEELYAVRSYAEAMESCAADNVGWNDPDALAEPNSARALLRRIG